MMTVAYICEWMEHSVKGVLSYFGIFLGMMFLQLIWVTFFVPETKGIPLEEMENLMT